MLSRSLCTLFVFVLFLTIHLRDNAFPYFYHTDEPSKVEQILSGHRNGRHPALMLDSAAMILKVSGWTPTRDHAVRAGRIVSAVLMAGVVALAFLWTLQKAGWLAAILAALWVGLQPQLLASAHFVKEEPALLFGLVATLLAAQFHRGNPGGWRTLALGLAAGLAVSGKWIGFTAILIAWAQLTFDRKALRPRYWLFFLAGILLIFTATNLTMLRQWNIAEDGISREVTSFYATDSGESRKFDLWHYAQLLPEVFPWPLLVLAVGAVWKIWRRPVDAHLRLVTIFPLFWFVMITCIPKTENRYLLPLTTFLALLAALGVHYLWVWSAGRRLGQAGTAVALIGIFTFQIVPKYRGVVSAFHHDHRRELGDWIRTHLPATAIILQDTKVGLPARNDRRFDADTPFLPQQIMTCGEAYASDCGSIEALRQRGVTHLALFPSNYLVLLERNGQKATTPAKKAAAAFYQTVRKECRVVFQRKKGEDRYLNPAIVLYELPPAS